MLAHAHVQFGPNSLPVVMHVHILVTRAGRASMVRETWRLPGPHRSTVRCPEGKPDSLAAV
jgi:hypothetical protein